MAQILDLSVSREVQRMTSLTDWPDQAIFSSWELRWVEMQGDPEDKGGAWRRSRMERFRETGPDVANRELASWDLMDAFVRELLEKEEDDG